MAKQSAKNDATEYILACPHCCAEVKMLDRSELALCGLCGVVAPIKRRAS